MRRLSIVVGTVALTALACSDPTSQLPTAPTAPGVTGLQLEGPSSIAPGQSAQLVAAIRLADGTTKQPSLSTPVQWFSSNTNILRVSSTGLATGVQVGEARITVFYGTGISMRQATKEFIVVPAGTYRLTGMITEAGFPSVSVIGARVEVMPGSLAAITGLDGRYTLYGVPSDSVVTISKAGYTTVSQALQLTAHATRNFVLALSGPRFMIAGPYTLTIDVTGSCSSSTPLSASLQLRSYEAVITQTGPEIFVTLTEPRFRINPIGKGNKFIGRAGTDGVTFTLDAFDPYYYYYYQTYYPSVAERLSDSTILVPWGTVFATGSTTSLSGSMQGGIYRWDARFPAYNSNVVSSCDSPAIKFTLTPR